MIGRIASRREHGVRVMVLPRGMSGADLDRIRHAPLTALARSRMRGRKAQILASRQGKKRSR